MQLIGTKFDKLPDTYTELVQLYIPKTIEDKVEYADAVEIVDYMAGRELSTEQDMYLDAISTFIHLYENEQFAHLDEQEHTLNEILEFLRENANLKKTEMGQILGDPSLYGRILKGERKLSKSHIKALRDHFKVEADLFF